MSQIIDTTERDEVIKTLKSLGLSAKEASVYLALLSLGEVGTTALSREVKLHRQFIYDTLASLEDKGLVGHSVVKGRKKFFSHGLSKLTGMFDHKKRIADELALRIEKKLLPVDIQEFEVYRGQEAFVANEFNIIKTMSAGSKLYVLGGTGDDYEKTMGKYFTEYEYLRLKKNIEVMYIGSASQKDYLSKNKDDRRLFSYRLLPSVFTGTINITVYTGGICFNIFGSPVSNFTIKSDRIAKSYADFFMGLWQISK